MTLGMSAGFSGFGGMVLKSVQRDTLTSAAVQEQPPPASVPMPEARLDVPACLKRVRRRDEEAARQLIQHLYPLVMKLVRSHLPRRTAEEDLAQVVFMKIFANLKQYSGKVPLEHWVSRIAVNTCLNQLRSEQSRPELRWADLSEDQQEVLETLVRTTDDLHPSKGMASREILERMMERLGAEDRLVLTLLHIEGRSVEEVRRVTGWSASLVKVRAFRARNKLRKHLAGILKEEELL